MKKTLDHVKDLTKRGKSFDGIVCNLSGWMDKEEMENPDKTYTAHEVAELFHLLFEIKLESISPKRNA